MNQTCVLFATAGLLWFCFTNLLLVAMTHDECLINNCKIDDTVGVFPPPLLSLHQQHRNCSLMQNMLSQCLHVSSEPSQRFNNTKYCTSSLPRSCPPSLPHLPPSFSNWEPLVHTGDPEHPVSPWAGRPRGSGSPCADSGSVNRADGFWQIHSDWKSFILLDFFSSRLFHATPHAQKELSVYL